MKAEKEEKW